MKKTKRTKKTNVNDINTVPGFSVTHIGTEEQARNEFETKIVKKSNEYVNRSEVVMFEDAVKRASQNGPFSILEIRRELRCANINQKRITELFSIWLKIQLDLHRVTEIPPSVYDVNYYLFI